MCEKKTAYLFRVSLNMWSKFGTEIEEVDLIRRYILMWYNLIDLLLDLYWYQSLILILNIIFNFFLKYGLDLFKFADTVSF